jgi:hypothetical protein
MPFTAFCHCHNLSQASTPFTFSRHSVVAAYTCESIFTDEAGDPDLKDTNAALIYTILRAASESRALRGAAGGALAIHANVRFVREMLDDPEGGSSEEAECAAAFHDALQWVVDAQTRMTAPSTASESGADRVPSAYRVLQERVRAGEWASVVRLVDCFRLAPWACGAASPGGSALQEAIESGQPGLALFLMLRAAQNIPLHGPHSVAALRATYEQLMAAGRDGGQRAGPQEQYTLRALEMLRSQVKERVFPANISPFPVFRSQAESFLRVIWLYFTGRHGFLGPQGLYTARLRALHECCCKAAKAAGAQWVMGQHQRELVGHVELNLSHAEEVTAPHRPDPSECLSPSVRHPQL